MGPSTRILAHWRFVSALTPPSVLEGARGPSGRAHKVRKEWESRSGLGAAASGTGAVLSMRQLGPCLPGVLRSRPRCGSRPRWVARLVRAAPCDSQDGVGPVHCFPGASRGGRAPHGVGSPRSRSDAGRPYAVPGRGDTRRASSAAVGLLKESDRPRVAAMPRIVSVEAADAVQTSRAPSSNSARRVAVHCPAPRMGPEEAVRFLSRPKKDIGEGGRTAIA